MSNAPGGIELILVAALLGLLPAWIAQRKGYSFLRWWIYGALLFILALPSALMMKPDAGRRRQCPHCRTWIDKQATVCPQCTRDVVSA